MTWAASAWFYAISEKREGRAGDVMRWGLSLGIPDRFQIMMAVQCPTGKTERYLRSRG